MNGTHLDSEREVTRSVSGGITEPQSTIGLLRARTAEHHHGLESGLRIQTRLSEAATRGPLIAGYFALYRETLTPDRAVLVPQLLSQGYEVVVFDTMFFGDEGLPSAPGLTVIEGDIRDSGAVYDAAGTLMPAPHRSRAGVTLSRVGRHGELRH